MKNFTTKAAAVGLLWGCAFYQPCTGKANSSIYHLPYKLHALAHGSGQGDELHALPRGAGQGLALAHSSSAQRLALGHNSSIQGLALAHSSSAQELALAHNSSAQGLALAHNNNDDAPALDFIPPSTKSILQAGGVTLPQIQGSTSNIAAPAVLTNNAAGDSLKILAKTILQDSRLDTIQARALRLLTGFAAGTSYGEVWIRDFNTFIRGSLQVAPQEKVKEMLLRFFQLQGEDGNIVDGFIPKEKAYVGYEYRYSDLAPGWAAHKNTVETDQESSLVQAIKKYIDATGDTSILHETVGGKTVLARLEDAFAYLLKDRWSEKYGLITGATTIDWGDVQPEKGWGVRINEHTKWAIDIYDNAMLLIALHDFNTILPKGYKPQRDWNAVAAGIRRHVRQYLWQPKAQKYLPHLYLNGSPFSAGFNEAAILYTGGTACAILAGLHNKAEIAAINRQMLAAAAKEKYATIGITVYPPYPEKEFPNMKPYVYQNAGDWTWFGGRMIQALTANGFVKEAYRELSPMIDRALEQQGFHEWYDVETGAPKGSGDFRGEAGVLYDAISQLRQWAKQHA